MRNSGKSLSSRAAIAPLPLPTSSASPVRRKPSSAQGTMNRRAKARYMRPVQKFFSNLDISVMTNEKYPLASGSESVLGLTPGEHRDPEAVPAEPEEGRDVRKQERLEEVQPGR